ncbi:MAG TPA: oxygen-independent coproporphyrinogen III oxidase [Vicinamibacterales bacterium]|nr:oxygen-independent coproporphyrinogen III oxidase [Vicinamibacterales bacterium]
MSPASPSAAPVPVELLTKYDRPGPRYTSYPTAVEFHEGFDETAYRRQLAQAAEAPDAPLSLYVHLPFCEERCSFCGCTVIITRKREVAARYLEPLEREIDLLARALGPRRRVLQYHWGGGTPTYLSVEQIDRLHRAIASRFEIVPDAEAAIEVDPRVTSIEQLEVLRGHGFNRLSMGVQDFTPEVQRAVNRVQTEDATRAIFDEARRLGFVSINIDLIYGLPLQTRESFGEAVDTVISMRPDRVAVYSYAHVPWIRAHQKRLAADALPTGVRKLELFLEARQRLLGAGYRELGMDHFALPDDELARAADAHVLHRNFMGYTTHPAPDLVGVGVSAIGDVCGAFAQNVKKLPSYYEAVEAGRFPIERGYLLDEDDRIRRHVITGLMCNLRVDRRDVEQRFGIRFDEYFREELDDLARGPAEDGLVTDDGAVVAVTPAGRLLLRNVAMIFDRHLRRRTPERPVFSRTV